MSSQGLMGGSTTQNRSIENNEIVVQKQSEAEQVIQKLVASLQNLDSATIRIIEKLDAVLAPSTDPKTEPGESPSCFHSRLAAVIHENVIRLDQITSLIHRTINRIEL